MQKPFSQACENNKAPILEILAPLFADRSAVLEIGSGTGQHAVHFAAALPRLRWQSADQREYLSGIQQWLDEATLDNLPPAVEFEVTHSPWPAGDFDALFTANTLHIMSWSSVEQLFQRLARHMPDHSLLAVYGPFNYRGHYTSDSNARFDQWLKERDPLSGIRDFEAVNRLAEAADYQLLADHAMPANNRLLVWQKKTRS